MDNLIDLYIDESGRYYIGEPDYKFFMLSALILSSEEKELSTLLFSKWRSKYLNNPSKSFHSYDFFEDGTQNYKKHELSFARNFNRAVSEIIEILKTIDLKARVFYIDIEKLRILKKVRKPPIRPGRTATIGERQKYSIVKEAYSNHIKSILPEKHKFLPFLIALKQCFSYHETYLSLNTKCGYINFESQSNSDILLIESFHNFAPNNKSYNSNVLGIQLHTKRSLDSGIEISDLISYVSCQILRSRRKRYKELAGIAPERLDQIRKIQYILREKLEVKILDVTDK